MTATATVRTTHLEVRIDGVLDPTASAAVCSFGFDQRYAEATVRRTGGGTLDVSYWSAVEIAMGCTPGAGAALRFTGTVVPVDNQLYPIENVLICKGTLYRAAWVRNQAPEGTVLADPATGASDEAQVQQVLGACGVAFDGGNIAGTGKALGSLFVGNEGDLFTPLPWTWAAGEAGLDVIERLDAVSVPDDASGRYRTFETLGGDVFRIPLATAPAGTPDFSFTEGVDVLEARIRRDPTGAANVVTVDGAPKPLVGSLPAGVVSVATFTAATGFAPYLPPGVAAAATRFSSPLIEKSTVAETDPDTGAPLGDVLSCEAVAQFLLQERNAVLDTLEFSTPRDDLLGPGQTVHLHSPRLGITDPDQHYWTQRLEVSVDERGAFTQRLTCLRRS